MIISFSNARKFSRSVSSFLRKAVCDVAPLGDLSRISPSPIPIFFRCRVEDLLFRETSKRREQTEFKNIGEDESGVVGEENVSSLHSFHLHSVLCLLDYLVVGVLLHSRQRKSPCRVADVQIVMSSFRLDDVLRTLPWMVLDSSQNPETLIPNNGLDLDWKIREAKKGRHSCVV